MTGCAGAIAGLANNRIFTSGLVKKLYSGYAGTNTAYFDSATPYNISIDAAPASQSWFGGNYSALWIGYYLSPVTGNSTFSLQISGDNYKNQNYFWLGNSAISGYNSGNALIAGGGGASGTISLLSGQYYPIRIQVGYQDDSGFFESSDLSFSLLINSSSSYTVFYNSLTTGF